MNQKRATLEVIAPTVEEAIAKGLTDLGLSEKDVDIEVLDEGTRGLFGLGSRQARIRITIKEQPEEQVDLQAFKKPIQASPLPGASSASEASSPAPSEVEDVEKTAPATTPRSVGAIPGDIVLHVAKETVSELLEKMKVKADVEAYFGEVEEAATRTPVHVDVHGEDLSFLIGRQAETLNALQYIAGLIVGKELGHSVSLIIDVEGYRQRREQQLRQLARRMADQAVATGKRQILEPMPANERRLIHLELRDHPNVITESVGEEPYRKVTIVPR